MNRNKKSPYWGLQIGVDLGSYFLTLPKLSQSDNLTCDETWLFMLKSV